eukprot:4926498-Prymnesium_polylepis.1
MPERRATVVLRPIAPLPRALMLRTRPRKRAARPARTQHAHIRSNIRCAHMSPARQRAGGQGLRLN